MSPGGVDHDVLRRHLLALDASLTRLERHAQVSADVYAQALDLQWTIERGLLVATQNVLDIATHVAASAGLDVPDYGSSLDALAQLGVIPQSFAQQLRPLAGFRNILVHAYLSVDASRVHTVLATKLPELRQFAISIERYLSGTG
jgi:uncharacterized protein YutE (UPF0331/DUF86 family)